MNLPETSSPIQQDTEDTSTVIEEEDLVDEVSIDGMCGVY